MKTDLNRADQRARRFRRTVAVMVTACSLSVGLLVPAAAQADNAMSLSGPKQYKSWLYESGKVGAVIAVRISDPKAQVAMVKWCLDFGGKKAACKERSPQGLGWKSTGGWSGDIMVKGGRLTIQSCQIIDETKPKVALIVQAFDRDGVRVAQRRHVMTHTCNV